MNLSSRVKLIKVKDHSAAATTDVVSDFVDTAGYGGVLFLTSFGTAAANNTLKAQQATASDGSDAADLAGTSVTSGTSDEDVWLDLNLDGTNERYLGVTAARGTSSTLESVWAILYNPRALPVDNTTTGTITGEFHQSTEEGTV